LPEFDIVPQIFLEVRSAWQQSVFQVRDLDGAMAAICANRRLPADFGPRTERLVVM